MISKSQPLWDPLQILGIINPSTHTQTCIGYAPSQGRRCRNAIRADNRALMEDVCDEISYMQPDSTAVLKKLRKIAGPALCVRWHQGQADEVVREWRGKIRELMVESESDDLESDEEIEVKPVKSVRSGSSKKRGGGKDRSLSDAEDELKKIIDRYVEMRDQLRREKQEERDAAVSQWLSDYIKDQDKQEEERKSREKEEKRQEQIRMEKDRLEQERLEKEFIENRRIEKERVEKQRLERERLEKERREKERQEKERLEKERVENARREKERLEKERQEQERVEREQRAKDEKKRQDQERNERIRQRAEKRREEAERLAREKEQKEQEQWGALWKSYQERWVEFKASTCRDREDIPWPVRESQDVKASTVKDFFQKFAPRDADMGKFMKKESLKWHPNCPSSLPRLLKLGDVDLMRVEMICRVLTGLIDEYAGKEAGCFV